MEPTTQKKRLAWHLLAAVVVYHANNVLHLTRPVKNGWHAFDASRAAIAGVGHTARYFLGQENSFFFFGQKQPHQRLYERSDLDLEKAGLEKHALPHLAKVTTLFRAARCRGIIPMAALIPPKSIIERERLPEVLPPNELWESLGPKVAEDAGIGHRVLRTQDPRFFLDLFKPFHSYHKQFPEEDIYVPWDYHLTSYGMAIVTAEIVKQLAARGEPIAQPTLVRRASMPAQYLDNLVTMLHLPDRVLTKLPQFSWTEPIYEVEAEGKLTGVKRVVLLGTSFSGRLHPLKLALGHMLEKTLHVPVVEALANGRTTEDLLTHLASQGQSLRSGDLLIVEQPFKNLQRKLKPFPKVWTTDRALASAPEALAECLSFGH